MAKANIFVKEVVQGTLNRMTTDRMVPATGDQDSLSDAKQDQGCRQVIEVLKATSTNSRLG
jgi:hypothetical protein